MQRAVCLTCSTEPKYAMPAERESGKPPAPVILSRNKGEIPLWYKRAGIYSPLPPPLTCNSRFNPWQGPLRATRAPIATSDRKDRVVVPLKALRSLDKSMEAKGEGAPWFFMWAARPRRLTDTYVRGPQESYGNFSNCALVQADTKTDSVTFEFASPVPYAVDGVPYPPHIHFTQLLSDDIWDTRIWSMNVPPVLSRQETAQSIQLGYLVINALPLGSMDGKHIRGTARLPYNVGLSTMSRLLRPRVRHHTPMVLYCAGPRCNASHVLMEKLLALGYTNLLRYPGGLEEWGGDG